MADLIYPSTLLRLRAGAFPGFRLVGGLIVFPTGELAEVHEG